jgi:hypothetical protein
MRGLSLEWKYCPDGVEEFDYGPPQRRKVKERRFPAGIGLPSKEFREVEKVAGPAGIWFRARTSRRYPIRIEVADLDNPVVVHFVNARDNNARERFLGRFGFLEANQSECGLDELIVYQQEMRRLLVAAGSDEPDIAAINKRLRGWQSDVFPLLDGRRLSFELASLHGLMLREIVMVVEKDARLATCQHCRLTFLTGPTTGRRSHSVYCSDRCRVAAMRARNAT